MVVEGEGDSMVGRESMETGGGSKKKLGQGGELQ